MLRLSPLTCSSGFAGVRLWQIMCRITLKVRVNLNHVVCITERLSLMQQRRLSAGLAVSPSGFWLYWRSFITKCGFQETAELRILYIITSYQRPRQAAGQKLQKSHPLGVLLWHEKHSHKYLILLFDIIRFCGFFLFLRTSLIHFKLGYSEK